MATPRIDINGDDLRQLNATFDKLRNINLASVLADVGEYLVGEAQERFTHELTPEGQPWTQSQRAKEDGGLTLTDERNLARSLHYQLSGSELLFGSDEVYAAIHQFGGNAGRNESVTIEARPFIGIAVSQRFAIEQLLNDWMLNYVD